MAFFLQNLGPFSLMAAKQADCRVKNRIFGENLVIKGLSAAEMRLSIHTSHLCRT